VTGAFPVIQVRGHVGRDLGQAGAQLQAGASCYAAERWRNEDGAEGCVHHDQLPKPLQGRQIGNQEVEPGVRQCQDWGRVCASQQRLGDVRDQTVLQCVRSNLVEELGGEIPCNQEDDSGESASDAEKAGFHLRFTWVRGCLKEQNLTGL
jgi:hypothetical protein